MSPEPESIPERVEDESEASSPRSTPDPQVVEEYNELMRSVLPAIKPVAPAPVTMHTAHAAGSDVEETALGRPMTKAEKQNAKKRRRKERERDAKAEQVKAEKDLLQKEAQERPVCA